MKGCLLPVEDVLPDPENVRDDLGDLTDLAASLRVHGLLQPLVVRPAGRRFVVVDGHRRYEAALLAGLNLLPCIVTRAKTGSEVVETMLAAAMHRQLSPFEQARAFGRLRDAGMGAATIAKRTGYSAATVRDRLALLGLPPEALAALAGGHATVAASVAMAREVGANGNGAAMLRAPKARWLSRQHPLADVVGDACTHRSERVTVGGVGCGQCWERAIRDDALAQVAS